MVIHGVFRERVVYEISRFNLGSRFGRSDTATLTSSDLRGAEPHERNELEKLKARHLAGLR